MSASATVQRATSQRATSQRAARVLRGLSSRADAPDQPPFRAVPRPLKPKGMLSFPPCLGLLREIMRSCANQQLAFNLPSQRPGNHPQRM